MSINCVEPADEQDLEASSRTRAALEANRRQARQEEMARALENPNLDPKLRAEYANALRHIVMPT